MRYWQPLQAKSTVTHSLPHADNKQQWNVNSFWTWLCCNQYNVQIFEYVTESLTALIGMNTMYQRKNTDSKLIDIANCKSFKSIFLVVKYAILIWYYTQTANTRALYESVHRPTGQPADNPPNSDELGDFQRTVPDSMVQVYLHPWPLVYQRFRLDRYPDPMWQSRTIVYTSTVNQLWLPNQLYQLFVALVKNIWQCLLNNPKARNGMNHFDHWFTSIPCYPEFQLFCILLDSSKCSCEQG